MRNTKTQYCLQGIMIIQPRYFVRWLTLLKNSQKQKQAMADYKSIFQAPLWFSVLQILLNQFLLLLVFILKYFIASHLNSWAWNTQGSCLWSGNCSDVNIIILKPVSKQLWNVSGGKLIYKGSNKYNADMAFHDYRYVLQATAEAFQTALVTYDKIDMGEWHMTPWLSQYLTSISTRVGLYCAGVCWIQFKMKKNMETIIHYNCHTKNVQYHFQKNQWIIFDLTYCIVTTPRFVMLHIKSKSKGNGI